MSFKAYNKKAQRRKRHRRLRKHLAGTADRPRLAVYRSLTNVYAQVIDDGQRVTVASASSLKMNVSPGEGESQKIAQAKAVGKEIAEKAIANGIKQVAFDRGGFLFHGRIRALADAAREAGLEF